MKNIFQIPTSTQESARGQGLRDSQELQTGGNLQSSQGSQNVRDFQNNQGLLISQGLSQIFQIFFVATAILYVIFALLVVRQIDLMKRTLITPVSPIVTTLGIIHLGAAIFVLWLSAVWL